MREKKQIARQLQSELEQIIKKAQTAPTQGIWQEVGEFLDDHDLKPITMCSVTHGQTATGVMITFETPNKYDLAELTASTSE